MLGFQVTLFTLVLISVGTIYAPTLLLGQGDRLSRDELVTIRPDIAYVRWTYPLVHALWALTLLTFSLLFAIYSFATAGVRAIYPVMTFPAGAALFDGVFSLVTGVRPVATKGGYLFTDTGTSRTVPVCQVVLSAGLICGSVAVALL